ncbi:MAG TPA: toll/interleukin-1 receptor domain-containing protein [Sideroxyarcus sp.]|nr:toll/interleukin-1 receptor domain-containing protein [Sideroxyarcus sp.]
MFKVFVSYSTQDLKNVAELQQSLAGTGIDLFVAEYSVIPSEKLSDRISTAIAACDLFIVLWSSNAKESDWVSQEIGQAHSLNKKILPLVLTEGLNLPGFIKDLKYLPVYKDAASAIQQAHAIVLDGFRAKVAEIQKQKQSETLTLLGLGALFFWAVSQK